MIEEMNQIEPQEVIEQPQSDSNLQEIPPKPQSNEAEINFARLRKENARIERERDEYARKIQQLEAQQKGAEEDFSIAPDELVEGKHLSKYEKRVKELERKVEEYKQNASASTDEIRLRAQYPDFDKVVTTENIELLRDLEPELASSINSDTNLSSKATAVYKLIKKFGIYKEDNFKEDREHAQNNANKPRPLASVSPQQGDSPLSRANAFAQGLTDELKEQLRKEMYEARRRN